MESNATMVKAEALIRFMVYTNPNRQHAMPLASDMWVDRQTALSDRYALGTPHTYTTLTGFKQTAQFVVAMLPLIRRVADPNNPANKVLHVTVYYARADEWHLFAPVDSLTPRQIRESMHCLAEN